MIYWNNQSNFIFIIDQPLNEERQRVIDSCTMHSFIFIRVNNSDARFTGEREKLHLTFMKNNRYMFSLKNLFVITNPFDTSHEQYRILWK